MNHMYGIFILLTFRVENKNNDLPQNHWTFYTGKKPGITKICNINHSKLKLV